ncbi:hypothetical protein RlegWSM1455_26095 (plasmid) [Rhizobium laguerreae]|uniref:hypothetical protein n=1 Tax=Rhizobium laguerreae TaxID=1076926 RepID=UPI001E3EE23B|nr:hypothetical protein [Rhizobium laguerreae]UFW67790.1 hypothetical protein RlegWSM1455_26095 [Rhizobium laguerreae]
MSAVFELQIDQPFTRTTNGHGTVVTVRQVADEQGIYPDAPFETAIVAEGLRGTDVVVPAGWYRLEARFPDGRVLRENRVVETDGREIVRFESLQSPHEWLAWQSLSGNVPQLHEYALRRETFLRRDNGLWQQKLMPKAPLEFLSVIATMRGLDHVQPADLPVDSVFDDHVGLWRTTLPDFLNDGANPDPRRPRRRIAAVVSTSEATLFAFIPGPWTTADGGNADIEVLYDPTLPNERGLRVSVVDGERSALLSYLGSSRMFEASITFDSGRYGDQILQLIQDKRQNPFAAAAAAYAGLAFAVGDERRERWSPWLENLMNWFPELPDGAILFARDRLDRAKSTEDLIIALKALRTGFMRGPPAFSAGIRHLLDGLAYFQSSKMRSALGQGEFDVIYREVSALASFADPAQTFTVLKLRPGFPNV